MLSIAIASLVWYVALIGLGWPLLRTLGFNVDVNQEGQATAGGNARSLTAAPLIAMVLLASAGAGLNILMAISTVVASAAMVLGLSLAILYSGQIKASVRNVSGLPAALITVLVLLAIVASQASITYDSGLYHLQAVRWLTSGAMPTGLANLHGRLGFNSIWFCAAAMVECCGCRGESLFVIQCLIILSIVPETVYAVRRCMRQHATLGDAVWLLSIYPIADYAIRRSLVSSLSNDLPVLILTLLVVRLLIDVGAGIDRFSNLYLAVVLSVFAVANKLTALPLAILTPLVLLWNQRILVHVASSHKVGRYRSVATLLLVAMTITIWLTRGALLSGCLAYPSAISRIDRLIWAVPLQHIRDEAAAIRAWARLGQLSYAGASRSGDGWLIIWLHRVTRLDEIRVLIGLCSFATVALVITTWRDWRWWQSSIHRKSLPLSACLVSAVGIIYWFILAPDVRFGYGYLFGLAAMACCVGVVGLRETGGGTQLWGWIALSTPRRATALTLYFIIVALLVRLPRRVVPGALIAWPSIPRAMLRPVRTMAGDVLLIPVRGDQAWDASGLCTPQFRPDLKIARSADGRPTMFYFDHMVSP